MSTFDDMLAIEQAKMDQIYGSSNDEYQQNTAPMDPSLQQIEYQPQEPTLSLYDTKVASTDAAEEQKKAEIDPNSYVKRNISYMEDADSGWYQNGDQWRANGFDAYEQFHKGQLEDQTVQANGRTMAQNTRARINRDKDKYSKQFNVPREEVTDTMIYDEGVRETLGSYANMAGVKGFDSKSVDVSGYQGQLHLGSKEDTSLLGLKVAQRRNKDGSVEVGRYGREISDFRDLEDGSNINDKNTNRYNITAYKDGKFDKIGARDKLAEIIDWPGTKPSEITDPKEMEDWNEFSSDVDQSFLDKALGFVGSSAQRMGWEIIDFSKTVQDIIGIDSPMDYAYRAAKATGLIPEDEKDQLLENLPQKALDGILSNDPKAKAKMAINAGLSAKSIEDKEKNYAQAEKLWSAKQGLLNKETAQSIPHFIKGVVDSTSESVPEMAMAVMAAPALIGSRLNKQNKAFKKKNKRDMNGQELAIFTAWNTFNVYFEKIGITIGAKEMIKLLGKKKAESMLGKGWQKILGAGVAMGGEFVQESSEGAIDAFADVKAEDQTIGKAWEIASSPKNTAQAMQAAFAAGGMAGTGLAAAQTLNTVAAVPGAAKDVFTWANKKQGEKKLANDIENMSDAEYHTKLSAMGKGIEDHNDNIQNIKKAKSELNDIKNVQEMQESNNLDISEHANNIIKSTTKSEEFLKSEPVLDAVFEEIVTEQAEGAMDALGINDNSTDEEISIAINNADTKTISEILKEEVANELAIEYVNENIDTHKASMDVSFDLAEKSISDAKQSNIDSIEHVKQTREKVKSRGTSTQRSNEEVDINNKSLAQESEPTSMKEAAVSAISGLFSSKKKKEVKEIYKTLSQYSDESLNNYIEAQENEDNPNTKVARVAEKVLSNRDKSRSNRGTGNSYDEFSNFELSEDKLLSKSKRNRSKNFQKIKRIVSQGDPLNKKNKSYASHMIDESLKEGMITKGQANVLRRRLEESSPGIEVVPYTGNKSVFESSKQIQKKIDESEKQITATEEELVKAKVDELNNDEIIDIMVELKKEKEILYDLKKDHSDTINAEIKSYDKNQESKTTEDTTKKASEPTKQEDTTEDTTENTRTEEDTTEDTEMISKETVVEEIVEENKTGKETVNEAKNNDTLSEDYSVGEEKTTKKC